ncbi:hypothetical protein MTR_0441s0020 [Medicago truncatula]|uniref:Uncharacterized protein n=1 Tax=Medicago truncatula TaxID=3880 RepID=A0A072TQU9_MEDTR|nr:hypothetical protein MTR_0441s0020 [Medicago truncatula]
MKYADLLPSLLKKHLVQTRPPPKVPERLPAWYRPDKFCAFHQGAPGPDTEYCYALKAAVQKLIRDKDLGKWTPNNEGSYAMTFTTLDGDKLALPVNTAAVKKYSVKK